MLMAEEQLSPGPFFSALLNHRKRSFSWPQLGLLLRNPHLQILQSDRPLETEAAERKKAPISSIYVWFITTPAYSSKINEQFLTNYYVIWLLTRFSKIVNQTGGIKIHNPSLGFIYPNKIENSNNKRLPFLRIIIESNGTLW